MDEAGIFFLVLLLGAVGQLLDGTLGMGFGVFSASVLLAAGFPRLLTAPVSNPAAGSRPGFDLPQFESGDLPWMRFSCNAKACPRQLRIENSVAIQTKGRDEYPS